MSNYKRTYWKDSPETEITAEALNNMEEGIVQAFIDTRELDEKLSVDYVVEQGTNGIWTYRKWASGIAECWCNVEQSVNITSLTWNNGMYYGNGVPIDYPFEFTELPVCNITKVTYDRLSILSIGASGTESHTPTIRLISTVNNASSTEIFSYSVVGRWK